MKRGTRDVMVNDVVRAIESVVVAHPVRVAIDGPPASGKTTLAEELAGALRAEGRCVIRASIEDFLRPRAQRYRRGELSAESNYHDAFDLEAIRRVLLDPLGPGGNRRFQPAIYARETDSAVVEPVLTAPDDAVLIFEGVFLMRGALDDGWDLRIAVAVEVEEILARARVRDKALNESASQVEERYRRRYLPGQQLYDKIWRPTERADILLHNDDPRCPTWRTHIR